MVKEKSKKQFFNKNFLKIKIKRKAEPKKGFA
jgi:hypothetical protein